MRTRLRRKYMHQLDTCGGLVRELTSMFSSYKPAHCISSHRGNGSISAATLRPGICSKKDNIVFMTFARVLIGLLLEALGMWLCR